MMVSEGDKEIATHSWVNRRIGGTHMKAIEKVFLVQK